MSPTPAIPIPAADPHPSQGGRLVTADGRTLPLRGIALEADAAAGLARVVLRQTFHNPHPEPLVVTYSVPLPADGAVSGYAFRIGDRRIVGEIDRREAARERFERALAAGHGAALLEQDRSSLFTQEIGNVPPGVEVAVELTIDQPLAWLDEGAWEWRFPTVVGPRYLGAVGRVADAARIVQDVADGPLPARATLALAIRDRIAGGRRPESPSHATRAAEERGAVRVSLVEEGGARLDRDVVVRWPVAAPAPGVALDVGRPAADRSHGSSAYGLLAIVPAAAAARREAIPRDLVVLLDTSGSMAGEPLDQARRVVGALIDSLGARDRLELIEFSDRPRRWRRGAADATERARRDAHRWLAALQAGGGTEMRDGLREALRPLRRDAQRQVVLVTDGYIGFEEEIVAEILERLPAASRLHVVGVGSAVNRTLTAGAARAGLGVEVVVAPGEDAERAAARIVARTAAPQVVGLELSGSALRGAAARRLPDLFAGAPARLPVELRPEGGELVARGRGADGPWEARVVVPPVAAGEGSAAVVALFGRERVEDLEARRAAGEDAGAIDAEVERLGLAFGIATGRTSWIAVTEEPAVDPRDPVRRLRVPHELPHGTSIDGFGLREAAVFAGAPGMAPMSLAAPPAPRARTARFEAQTFTGVIGRSGGYPPADAGDLDREVAEEGAAYEPPPAPRRLRARIALLQGGDVVIEIEIDAPLDWAPGDEVDVGLADGTWVDAAVDAARTTRPGRIEAGRTIRLALRLPAGEPAGLPVVAAIVHGGGERLELEVA